MKKIRLTKKKIEAIAKIIKEAQVKEEEKKNIPLTLEERVRKLERKNTRYA